MEEALNVMEQIETIVEKWQKGELDSEEALEQITIITDSI